MSGHAILPSLVAIGGSTIAVLVNVVGRKGRRAIILLFGLLMIGGGLGAPQLVPALASAAWIGWIVAGAGALLMFAAGPGWRYCEPVQQDESDLVLKPATDRQLRHFGEAP